MAAAIDNLKAHAPPLPSKVEKGRPRPTLAIGGKFWIGKARAKPAVRQADTTIGHVASIAKATQLVAAMDGWLEGSTIRQDLANNQLGIKKQADAEVGIQPNIEADTDKAEVDKASGRGHALRMMIRWPSSVEGVDQKGPVNSRRMSALVVQLVRRWTGGKQSFSLELGDDSHRALHWVVHPLILVPEKIHKRLALLVSLV